MPKTNSRAIKWLKEKKAKVIKNKLGTFQVQLLKNPVEEIKAKIYESRYDKYYPYNNCDNFRNKYSTDK